MHQGAILHTLGQSLRESFFMFWATLWALIGGFALAGAVQAFAPRQAMRTKLGDHRPAAVARASVLGALSSSCSYAAAAMARSLFTKGADFVTSMIFMFASTNLVVELGVVLIVLIGWQFAVAEYVGGLIMIGLLALLGGIFLTGRRARQRTPTEAKHGHDTGHDTGHETGHETGHDTETGHEPESWRRAIRTRAGWANAATYTITDLTMLRRELIIGFLGAGLLAVAVPATFWHGFFWSGHGVWTSIENAVIGPFIAIVSFVCSIGNVPLAAALWQQGISFGGVISFIFADLIALPLVLIYRKYYGTKLALRMLAVFWFVMAVAGLATELIFGAAGLVPARRLVQLAPEQLSWNYETVLNLIFLAVLAVLYYLHRSRARADEAGRYAIDPVCGMQVEKAVAPAQLSVEDQSYWFCSERCRDRFATSALGEAVSAPAR